MNFTNKETYLAAVAEWKLAYAELSDDIRVSKTAFKVTHRGFSAHIAALKDFKNNASAATAEEKANMSAKISAYYAIRNIGFELYAHKKKANLLLQERRDGKVEANRQYHEARLKAAQ
jgi:hypothetical protein